MDSLNSVDSKLLSATLDGSVEPCIPNGCLAVNKTVELTDEGDEAERVGVLDYMPSYKHRPSDIKYTDVSSRIDLPLLRAQNSGSCDKESFIKAAEEGTPRGRDIELKTFSITESGANLLGKPCTSLRAAQRLAPLSCLSDDDELLVPAEGADTDDTLLQEVIVQSEQAACSRAPLSRGTTAVSFDSRGTQRETRPLAAASFRYIPKQFSIVRDAAWSNPDTARTSPINSPEPTGTVPVASKNNASASSHSSGCESVVGQRFGQQGQSSSRDQSPVGELNKDSEVHLAGDNSQPVEMLSVDRSQVDPSSLSRQNVVFLNDYFWPPTRALYRDDSGAVGERSEVEKRQERRDKRKKIHSLPVALAKDVAGYVGEGKTIEELMDYITTTDKDGTLKRKTSQDGHSSQDDTKKPYGPMKSSKQVQIPKAKSESNKANEMVKFCDGTSSDGGLDSSDSVDGTKTTLPGNCSSRILVLSGSDSLIKNSVSQDVGGTPSVSEDAKRKRKRKSHKALQRGGEDAKTGEDLTGKLAADFAEISLGTLVEFGVSFRTEAGVKEAQMEAVSSSLLNDLEDGTTEVEVCVERVTVHDRSSKHAKKSTEVKEDIIEVQSSVETTQPGEGAISSILKESSLPLDSEASTLVLSPTNDQSSHPAVTSIPSTGAASNSGPDEGVSPLEENGQWQEFQSKKKRMRNAAPQSFSKYPSMTSQKSATSAGTVPVAPQKKTAAEAVSNATVHASAAVRGIVDASHGQKFPIAAGYFPKVMRQGRYHGNIQSANDVSNSSDKLFHYVDFTAGNPIESSNKLQPSDDFQISNRQNEADFDVGRSDGATYARMAAKDSSGLSCGPQASPSAGILSSFGPQSEAALDKTTTVAETDDKVTYCKDKVKTGKSSNADRLTEPLRDRHKVITAEKSKLDKMREDVVAKGKKTEATNEKPGSKPSANLSKSSRVLEAARPAVVFYGKVDRQFSEQNSGISFEYSDDLVSGHPSSDVATRSVADAHIGSGRFQSCEAASSTSGGINCGRPIAPLTGTGHASLARAPVLIVTPLQKVLQEEEPVSRIIDADPETLKEATIVAPSACRSVPAEAKEPASRMSVASLLAGPSLAQNLTDHGGPGLADNGLINAASHSLQMEIGEHESVQRWNMLSPTPLKTVPEKKTHRERNSNRQTTSLQSSKKTFVFNVLEAAHYLTVDWEGLLIDDFAVYYSPDEQ